MSKNVNNNQRLRLHRSDGKVRKGRKNKGPKGRRLSRGAIYSGAVRQLSRDINGIRQFINAEIHYSDVNQSAGVSSSTATFVLLNGLITGDTVTTRTGDSIKLDGLDFRFVMFANATAVTTVSRVMIVQDRQCNAAIFAIGDLLSQTGTNMPISPYVPESQMRFRILFDRTYTQTTTGDTYIVTDESRLPVSGTHVQYNTGNAGTIADINTNSIYLIFTTDQAGNTNVIRYVTRLWFIDN